jgi:predicted DNA binding CopG/RHH family protein
LSEHDLAGIQRKAAEQGIPFQSLISGLIHQFVEGRLMIRTENGAGG